MRETPETTPDEQPRDEGVALSPYDGDLEPPSGDVEPEPYALDPTPGYDEERTETFEPPAEDTGTAVVGPPAATEPPATEEPGARTAVLEVSAEAPSDAAPAADEGAPDVVAPPEPAAVSAGVGGAAVAGAAVAGAATGPDTGVRRTRIMQPYPESNEPRRLMTEPEADARAERYAPAALPGDEMVAGTEYDRVPSRAGAHWWAILATLLLTPVAWYLLSDAGARMTLPAENQWETGVLNFAALGELVGGLVVLGVILWAARASSLGGFIVGGLLVLVGGAFVVAPAWVQQLLEPFLDTLRGYNDMGANIAHHLVADGSTGRILIAGFTLVMIGFVSHGARRRGRSEQVIRAAVERRRAAGY